CVNGGTAWYGLDHW
nr:immunoglobulin heavy chain junction region [Macaca mulatta]